MGCAGTTVDRNFLSGQDMRLFRTSRGLTRAELGEWLGVSESGVSMMEQRGAKKTVALALSAIDHGLRAWMPSSDDHRTPSEEEGAGD